MLFRSSLSIVVETDLAAGFNMNTFFIVNNKARYVSGMMAKFYSHNFGLGAGRTATDIHNDTIAIQPSTGYTWQLKPLDFEIPSDAICPITHDPLDTVGDGIYKCGACNNLIGYSAMKTWIASNRSCPLCRSRNINYNYYKICIDLV